MNEFMTCFCLFPSIEGKRQSLTEVLFMSQNSQKKFLIGAAVAAGVLSTLASILAPKQHKEWGEQAQDLASHLLDKKDRVNKNLLIGTLAGGVVGVTAALLLTPKAGSELLNDLYHPFSHSRREVKSKVKSAKKTLSKKVSKVKADLTEKVKEKKKAIKDKGEKVKKRVKKSVKHAADSVSEAMNS
jgi:gas vesicle protein